MLTAFCRDGMFLTLTATASCSSPTRHCLKNHHMLPPFCSNQSRHCWWDTTSYHHSSAIQQDYWRATTCYHHSSAIRQNITDITCYYHSVVIHQYATWWTTTCYHHSTAIPQDAAWRTTAVSHHMHPAFYSRLTINTQDTAWCTTIHNATKLCIKRYHASTATAFCSRNSTSQLTKETQVNNSSHPPNKKPHEVPPQYANLLIKLSTAFFNRPARCCMKSHHIIYTLYTCYC